MDKHTPVFLHLQRMMIDHAKNFIIQRKDAIYWISRLGISKEICEKIIKIMREDKLIERFNRDKIKIINPTKSENIDQNINKLVWEGFLE